MLHYLGAEKIKYSDYSPTYSLSTVYKGNAVEISPRFFGGDDAMYKFIKKEVNRDMTLMNIHQSGIVYIKMVINHSGSICNVSILQGINNDIDNACLKIIGKMPDWKPGMIGFEAVNTEIVIPIIFDNEMK
jgi:protein TonB